jgi:hypothetical protein
MYPCQKPQTVHLSQTVYNLPPQHDIQQRNNRAHQSPQERRRPILEEILHPDRLLDIQLVFRDERCGVVRLWKREGEV